jgi:cyclic dehypoxanthinyl futalosine synthase
MNRDDLNKKIMNGERVSKDEGLYLLQEAEILDLGELANEARFKKNPKDWITYVIDTNPNYSNICDIDCNFCAFYRHKEEEGAYTYPVDHLIDKFRESAEKGATTILLQGGVHPELPFEYYLELVERTVKEVPSVHPHFFSPPEIMRMAEISGLTIEEVLEKLWEKGLRSLPGGGAEILSDTVKKKISSRKGSSLDWLNVMRIAHRVGYVTTATMMYGHLEKDEDIIEHLHVIRQLQDETGGFMAFVPWSFKPGNTPLEKIIPVHASPLRYIRIIALARVFLDNFRHIQASWFSEGKKTGQIALHFGADDFGGTLMEENVHASADYVNKIKTDECMDLIRGAGFIPAQRTTLYDIISVDENSEAA